MDQAGPQPDRRSEPSVDPNPLPSYGKVLRSTSIVGGSAAIGMIISMISVKGGAVLLGPAGVGELRLYQSVLGIASTFLGFGLGPATVRKISHSLATGDREEAARSVATLHRLSVITGWLGWATLAAAALPLSNLVFDDRAYAGGLAIAGASVLFGAISSGYVSAFQGEQLVGTIARVRVASSFLTAVLSIACFWWLGVHGIVLSIVVSAAASVVVAKRAASVSALHLASRPPVLADCLRHGWGMAGMGLAMMAPSILACIVGAATGSLVIRQFDMGSNGLISAAMGLSVLFANFILTAMESDFFPRLSAVRDNDDAMNRLVNEQTEVGILLALPGLIGTISLAPLVLTVFYTAQFAAAADLLVWLVLGVFGRVTSWPASLVLLARGDSRTYLAVEVAFAGLQIGLVAVGIRLVGLQGVAVAYFAMMWLYNGAVLFIVNRKIGLNWTTAVLKLIAMAWMLSIGLLLLRWMLPDTLDLAAGIGALMVACVLSARGLIARLGSNHRLVAPLLRWRPMAALLGPRV